MTRIRTGRAWAIAAVLAAGFLPAAVAAGPVQTGQGNPGLAVLVPRIEGWAPSEAPRSFFPESLFEYIDGAAESYLSYDFKELLVVDLEKKGTPATLTLEIYDMGTPANAFGIFGAERYPENPSVAVGDLGYLDGEALNFLAGRFYVKLLGFGLGEGTAAVLGDVGAKLAGSVKERGGLPELVLAFPGRDLVARSEKYIKKNFMGYEFLRDGYVATYKLGGREVEGFFVAGGDEKQAEATLSALLAALAGDKQIPEKTLLGYHVKNRYGQHLYIGRVRDVLFGVMRIPDGLEGAGGRLFEMLKASLTGPSTAK